MTRVTSRTGLARWDHGAALSEIEIPVGIPIFPTTVKTTVSQFHEHTSTRIDDKDAN
jgi:hypothetical protein